MSQLGRVTRKRRLRIGGAQLCEWWRRALRGRQSWADLKHRELLWPNTMVVSVAETGKIPAGKVEGGERK